MGTAKDIVEKFARYGCYSVASVYFMVGLMAFLSFIAVAFGTMCYGIFMLISGIYYSFQINEGEEK